MFFNNIDIRFSNKIKNKKKLSNLKVKKSLFENNMKYTLLSKKLLFHFPNPWKITVLTTDNINILYLSSCTYFFRFQIPTGFTKVYFDKYTSVLSIENLYPNNYYSIYWKYLTEIFNAINRPYFLKLKFKGKGYYIYKNKRNTITPQFGYAHRIYLYAFYVSVKFLSKTSILVFGFSKRDIYKISHSIKSMRPINIFTGRGVRFSRSIVYKKQGKVSSYR